MGTEDPRPAKGRSVSRSAPQSPVPSSRSPVPTPNTETPPPPPTYHAGTRPRRKPISCRLEVPHEQTMDQDCPRCPGRLRGGNDGGYPRSAWSHPPQIDSALQFLKKLDDWFCELESWLIGMVLPRAFSYKRYCMLFFIARGRC